MKKNDIAMIMVVVVIAGVFSVLITNFIIAPSSERQREVEVVGPITSEFQTPDSKFFNKNSVNPTQVIRISENDRKDPFGSGQQ